MRRAGFFRGRRTWQARNSSRKRLRKKKARPRSAGATTTQRRRAWFPFSKDTAAAERPMQSRLTNGRCLNRWEEVVKQESSNRHLQTDANCKLQCGCAMGGRDSIRLRSTHSCSERSSHKIHHSESQRLIFTVSETQSHKIHHSVPKQGPFGNG